ncbi:hypothetical protein [Ketogulonicigenium vulgare]|uniref:hypothetical protein n=1 Tax=Ketogulonicigenium vulgare TaxID=92945 RepID=UPI0005C50B71|nr:hypothetical protein [Ketogulonicigenium vulgare]ALJ79987.1 hypothetical protein KVH_01575 [Ketogulonicigenium vulgare]ANW32877.1 hypothetical protein KvSKV_01580 [Ketogulonicigenium vulgare]
MRIFNRHSRDKAVPLVVLGSSGAEVFDYIFGDQPQYHPFWASSWSARSLGRAPVQDYVLGLLAGVDQRAHILLNFGMQDLIFGLPATLRAMGHRGVLAADLPAVVHEAEVAVASAILGQVALMRRIEAAGFDQVRAIFWALPPALPADYWLQRDLPALPASFVSQLYRNMAARMVGHRVDVLDLTAQFGGDLLHPHFARRGTDHHPDFIRSQRALWQRLQGLPALLPRRRLWRWRHWPHQRVMIADLLTQGAPRPRTMR